MHKEAYFTHENIDRVAADIRAAALPFSGGKSLRLQRDRCGLLILDMQLVFLSPASPAFLPASPPVLERIIKFRRQCIDLGLPVFLTRHVNTPADSGIMGEWWETLIAPENPLSHVSDKLLPSQSPVIEKTQYDAFYLTGLEALLRRNHIDSLIIVGVVTDICCETTVRSAFVRGFRPFLPIDLTAAPNLDIHRAAIKNLAHGFTGPVLSGEIMAELESA